MDLFKSRGYRRLQNKFYKIYGTFQDKILNSENFHESSVFCPRLLNSSMHFIELFFKSFINTLNYKLDKLDKF